MKSPKAENFINARDEKLLKQALNILPSDLRSVAETALSAAAEKRFFHWELEFPEIFYGPRPGTTQAIERLEGAGFDAVIGNPPYDVLASEELGYDVSDDLAFYETANVYEPAIRGARNLYKLFICRGSLLMGERGSFSFIVPMSLLGDDQAAEVRSFLFKKTSLNIIEAFPQKDDPRNRVFPEAKLATTIFVTRAKPIKSNFTIFTHPGRLIERKLSSLCVGADEIIKFDPENFVIPSCSQRDWEIAMLIWGRKVQYMKNITNLSEGEVHAYTHRDLIGPEISGPLILRGANISLYTVREASQGEPLRLNVKRYLEGKAKNSRAYAHLQWRVGFQRSSPQNNFRRLIAARIEPGAFCFDTVKFIPQNASKIDLDLLIAFLNSEILDWYFRLGSTNSKVNEYQFDSLPIPTFSEERPSIAWEPLFEKGQWVALLNLLCENCSEPGVMPATVAEALAEMSRRIQQIEAKRVLKSRSERSHLAPESQPIQDAIDSVLFRCYGLSGDDAEYIEQRLEEML